MLRSVASEGEAIATSLDAARINTPDWLWTRWVSYWGEARARAIAEAQLIEPPLDLTVKCEPELGRAPRGRVLPTGSVRLLPKGRIEQLPGFDEGAWWVQDVAASLPARLLGDVAGKRVADLCAAPGGKTAQLVLAGASVVAVDSSKTRLGMLAENLARLGLAGRDWSPPMPRPGSRTRRSMRCCSMRPAPRPAPSAAIPTSPI